MVWQADTSADSQLHASKNAEGGVCLATLSTCAAAERAMHALRMHVVCALMIDSLCSVQNRWSVCDSFTARVIVIDGQRLHQWIVCMVEWIFLMNLYCKVV
mmetsp:Transcript_26664/g.79243  ORF Transcript_26664/g.79243 Transcript_26664/m.79243 type:complete len:101 (-) Transcript_26664:929-1231(-)